MIAQAKAVMQSAMEELSDKQKNTLSVYNPLSFARNDVTVLDGVIGIEDKAVQTYTDVCGEAKTAVMLDIPAMSAVQLKIGTASASGFVFCAKGQKLRTSIYDVIFDENGYIDSLINRRADREVRNPSGAALGTLWFGENFPTDYDNWEIEDDVFLKLFLVTELLSREVVSDGVVEYRIRSSYRLSKRSAAVIDTVFYADDPRIDFEMKLDWHESHALLKAGFDVNIRSSFVKNEIQFGHIDRPMTRNTSLEAAQFEVCNHKWSDLSETRYGVAVLNDCKYSISAEGSDFRLTLQKAYELNYKPIVSVGTVNVPVLFEISEPNILCEAVKTAEDIENAYVLRLYECERNHTNCRLSVPNAKRVYLTNLLEEKLEELPIVNGTVELKFCPFEIKSVLAER